MKRFISLVTVLLMLFGLVSCSASEETLKGKWTRYDDSYGRIIIEFDGKGNASWGYEIENISFSDEGTYTVKDNTVTVSMKMWDESKLYTFTVSETALSLSSTNEVLGGALVGDYTVYRK